MAADELVLIVDRDDNVIDRVARHVMRSRRLLHRVTYIFVYHSDGRLLVQKRTRTKDLYPGYYDLAAGGVVCAGESYDESAQREAREELGIDGRPLERRFKFFFEQDDNRCWGMVYSCRHDGPFKLQPEEVESVEFVAPEHINAGAIAPVTPDTLAVFERLHPR